MDSSKRDRGGRGTKSIRHSYSARNTQAYVPTARDMPSVKLLIAIARQLAGRGSRGEGLPRGVSCS